MLKKIQYEYYCRFILIFSKRSNRGTLVHMFKCQYQTTLLLTNVVQANTKQEQQIQCSTNIKAIIGQCQVRKKIEILLLY
jgi:hypothetical protein